MHDTSFSLEKAKTRQFDYFYELIITTEIGRITTGLRGFADGKPTPTALIRILRQLTIYVGFLSGGVIGLPPVLNFGSPEVQSKIVPEVLQGKKLICLAISEAFAGSDVSALQTTAVKDADGRTWIINGTKKFVLSYLHIHQL